MYSTTHFLKLSVLPPLASLSRKKRQVHIRKLLNERMDNIAKERTEAKKRFLGLQGLKEQIPGEQPHNISRSSRPPCYTMCSALRKKFREQLRMREERYYQASLRFRLGDFEADFPAYSFKPPLHRKPRLEPFTPLSPEFLKQAA